MKGPALPRDAKGVFDDGEFCYVAASTLFGPHLTPVVYAFDGGRLWLTTSRGSAKARAWKADPTVAGVVRAGDLAVVFRGTVKSYDALDPFTWPSAAVSSPRLGKAATRFSIKNARFFFGYAVDAYRVPLAWAPPGRVFTAVEMAQGRVLDLAGGSVVDGWGEWPRGLQAAVSFAAPAAANDARELDAGVPPEVLHAVGAAGDGVLAVDGAGSEGPSLTVVPASWERIDGGYEARLARPFAELTGAEARSRAALTIDRASAWRAAEMRGILLRGTAETYVPGITTRGAAALRRRVGDDDALLRLEVERAVWWEGWSSGTVVRPARTGSRR